jgi:hypothetical protein
VNLTSWLSLVARLVAVSIFAASLSGCYISDHALIAQDEQSFPAPIISYETAFDPGKVLTFIQEVDAYHFVGDDAQTLRLKKISPTEYVAELAIGGHATEFEVTYAHAFLELDPKDNSFTAYHSGDPQLPLGEGETECQSKYVCIDELTSYIQHARDDQQAGKFDFTRAPYSVVTDELVANRANALLSAALTCQPPGGPDSRDVRRFRSTGSPQVLHLTATANWFENRRVDNDGPANQIAAVESRKRSSYFANYAEIGEARLSATDNSVVISCLPGASCLAERDLSASYCVTRLDGSGACASFASGVSRRNTGLRVDAPRPQSIESVAIGPLCPEEVPNATSAINTLRDINQNQRPPTGAMYLSGLSPTTTRAIRREPGTASPIIGDIAAASGPMTLESCKEVPGYTSQWCFIHWGDVAGWTSSALVAPTPP